MRCMGWCVGGCNAINFGCGCVIRNEGIRALKNIAQIRKVARGLKKAKTVAEIQRLTLP